MTATETEKRLRRLKIRSWRRGTKEMDLILGPFFDEKGADLSPEMLDLYEEMLEENDQDLYVWVSGREPAPVRFEPLMSQLQR